MCQYETFTLLFGSAEASAGFTSKANAGLTRNADLTGNKTWQKGGFQQALKGNVASSCKVKGEYLRRLLGDEVNLLKVSASGSAGAASKARGSGSASARLLQSAEDSKVEYDVLQSQTVKEDRKEQQVADDKSALLKAAEDYAGLKKIRRSGECIAFEVIKKDMQAGQLAYR